MMLEDLYRLLRSGRSLLGRKGGREGTAFGSADAGAGAGGGVGSGSSSLAGSTDASGARLPKAVTPRPSPDDRAVLPNMSSVKGSLLMINLLLKARVIVPPGQLAAKGRWLRLESR